MRTANDSYFTAMTYPQGLSTLLTPANIHDAIWGVLSAVYGGAIHPTAEGQAAMADAAMPAMREVLGIGGPEPKVRASRCRRRHSEPVEGVPRGFRALLRTSVAYATPSFFCRLVDEVVYWKVSFLSG